MGTDDFCFFADAGQGALDHFVGNRMGKYDQQIRRSDAAFHVRAGFAEYLGFTAIFTAGITILPFHALISSKYDYAHDRNSLSLVRTS